MPYLHSWCIYNPAGGHSGTAQQWHPAPAEDFSSPNSFQQRAVSEQVCLLLGRSGVPWLTKGNILTALKLASSSEGRIYRAREKPGAKSVVECAVQWKIKQGQGESVWVETMCYDYIWGEQIKLSQDHRGFPQGTLHCLLKSGPQTWDES